MRRGGSWTALFSLLLLAAPPLVRLALFYSKGPGVGAPQAGSDVTDGAVEGLAPGTALAGEATRRIAVLEDDLRRAREDLRELGSAPPQWHARAWSADVLPLEDPVAGRSALWVVARKSAEGGFRKRAACLAVGTGAPAPLSLVGRVRAVVPGTRLAQVETLLDPGFRVRVRLRSASAILAGTGRLSNGFPILELRHFSETVVLEEGDGAFTEGEDGFFPPDILVGTVSAKRGEGTGLGWVVLARPGIDQLRKLLVVESEEGLAASAWSRSEAAR